MPDEILDGSAASSTATDAQADTSAGTQNTDLADAQVPFHQHPRFQELIQQNRTYRGQIEQVGRTVQSLQQELQAIKAERQAAGQTQPSQEEVQAGNALVSLIRQHPELRGLLDAPKQLGNVRQLTERLERMERTQHSGITQSGRKVISDFVTSANLPKDSAGRLERYVLGHLHDDPDAMARFTSGDVSVIGEVLADLKTSLLDQARRDGTAALGATKNQLLRTVPPRQAGSQSGAVAPPKLEPGKEREHLAALHKQGDEMLERMLKG